MEHIRETPTGIRAGKREWLGLCLLALPAFIVSIDVFVLLLALPHISRDLGADSIQQLWIMDIYGFVLAGIMITMGSLGDRIGHRRLLLAGASVFGIASILAAYSSSPEMLILSRALLGMSGASLAPSSLALISHMFTDPKQRSIAIGIWLASFMSGAIIGPPIGGLMLENFWWGSVFLLGLPAMAPLLILWRVLPERRYPSTGSVDLLSIILSLAAILSTIYGLKGMVSNGLALLPLITIVFGLAVSVLFVRRQRTLTNPMLDISLFSKKSFNTAVGAMLFGTLLMSAVMLYITQYLQIVRELSPLSAGLLMIPGAVVQTFCFLLTPIIARWIRPAYIMGAGLTVSLFGLLLLTWVDAASDYTLLVIAYSLIIVGATPLVTLTTDMIINSAPLEKAGSAASVGQTSGELGFSLGFAVFGSLGTFVYQKRLDHMIPAEVPTAAIMNSRDTLTSAIEASRNLPDQIGSVLLDTAREAFIFSMHTVFVVCAIAVIIAAILILTLLREFRSSGVARVDEPDSNLSDVSNQN